MYILACWMSKPNNLYPPVAQLDNAADSDSEERGFESLRAGQKKESINPCGWCCSF